MFSVVIEVALSGVTISHNSGLFIPGLTAQKENIFFMLIIYDCILTLLEMIFVLYLGKNKNSQ